MMTFMYHLILILGVGLLLSAGAYFYWSSMGKFMVAMGAIASVSAYTFLVTANSSMPLLFGLLISLSLGTSIGLLISFLGQKVKPEEFILITLAAVEFIRRLAFHLVSLTGGAYGIRLSTNHEILSNFEAMKVAIGVIAVCGILIIHIWFKTLSGLEWRIVGHTQLGAQFLGINTLKTGLLAGSVGGLIGAIAGIGYAMGIGYVHPNDLSIDISLVALATGISVTSNNLAASIFGVGFVLFISREVLRLINLGGTLRFGYFDIFLGLVLIFLAIKLSKNS